MSKQATIIYRLIIILALYPIPAPELIANNNNILDRDSDPVIMSGDSLIMLNGRGIDEIVGFRFYHDQWQQIPIQIDERKYVDYDNVYNESNSGYGTIAYCDPTTYVGADTDPFFDSDDELVFMAKDAGTRAPQSISLPFGVTSEISLEVSVRDPLSDSTAYIYLFKSIGDLKPDADQDYVIYDFNLLAGSYIPNYNTDNGPNPEDSIVCSDYYCTHFSERWTCDEINIFAGEATGVDILDREKFLRAIGECHPTEDSCAGGWGAFFANKDGPVRAIRSSIGCVSGPWIQWDKFFYQQRQDMTFYIRAHPVSGVMFLYDYERTVEGLKYYNDLNLDGVLIDGSPDTVIAGEIKWEMVSGPPGTLIMSHYVETDIDPFPYTSYYSDDINHQVTPCTSGDGYEYGVSGIWRNADLPNTDPKLGSYNILNFHRSLIYEAPDQSVELAEKHDQQIRHPLVTSLSPYRQCLGNLDDNNRVDALDLARFASYWLDDQCASKNRCDFSDLTDDGIVNLEDLLIIVENWLLDSALVAHWAFDGDYNDSANSHHGTRIGDPVLITDNAKRGTGAVQLDGVDDFVKINGFKCIAGGQSRTVCAWIRTDVPGRVIIAWGPLGASGCRWVFGTNAVGQLWLGIGGGGSITGTADICDGDWHHVAVVAEDDGSPNINEVKLYVDGLPDAPSVNTADLVINTLAGPDVTIGQYNGAGFLEGTIDEVRIYNRALDADEIEVLANP